MATTNYLGKCKEAGCDYVLFATAEDVQDAEGLNDVQAGTGVYRVGNYGLFARCVNRHKVFPVKAVKGTYSEKHQCDSRCLNARGWSCTCSCGGANHGRGHVATITNASDLPTARAAHGREKGLLDLVAEAVVRDDFNVPKLGPLISGATLAPIAPAPAPKLSHVGVIGKTITGEVFVKAVKPLANGSTLYTFRATDGGHYIKWFAPSYVEESFEVGHTFKLRAKVKAHNDFQGVPETLVTYVEEVE